jgi:hypothetical protein
MTLGTAVNEAFPDIRKRALDLEAQVSFGTDPAAAKTFFPSTALLPAISPKANTATADLQGG